MKVILYSTPFCGWCSRTKEFFKSNNIKFKNIDISTSAKKVQEMVKLSGQSGVPVIKVDGEIIVGFDESALRKALHLKPRKFSFF